MEKQANPIPQGKYVPATRWGNLIFTAGMTSRKNGVLILAGQVKGDAPLETYQEAVCQAASNALAAAVNQLAATDYLCEQLGAAGVAARAALGVASLPGNAPVEIQMVCAAS